MHLEQLKLGRLLSYIVESSLDTKTNTKEFNNYLFLKEQIGFKNIDSNSEMLLRTKDYLGKKL